MSYGDSGGAYAPPPRVRFDAISEAWNLLTKQMGAWVLATLIYSVIVGGAMMFLYGITIGAALIGGGSDGPNIGAMLVGFTAMMLAASVGAGFFLGGFQNMAQKQLRGEQIQVGDLFGAGYATMPMIGAYLLIGLAASFGSYLLVLPGMLLASLWMLTGAYIVDRRMGAIEAMTASWNAIKGDMWSALGLYLVASLLASAGSFLCGVGVLFTMPILFLVQAIVYRDLNPDRFTPEAAPERFSSFER